jgi:medium-chain acyl-[acyl-carrier-protein] hydrolase
MPCMWYFEATLTKHQIEISMELRYSIHQETFKIKAFELDTEGYAVLSVLANTMQEAAGVHAAKLGLSMQSLLDNQQTWILNRFSVKMLRYPRAGEHIRIETWPSSADRLFAYRDFELFDENDDMILAARTTWLILDINRRRPIPSPPEVIALGEENERFADIQLESRLPKIESEPEHSIRFPVRRSDLDVNRHVNNVKYLEMVLETLGEGEKATRPAYFDIQFKAESVYGDVLIAERHPKLDGKSLLRVARESDQKELCVAIAG